MAAPRTKPPAKPGPAPSGLNAALKKGRPEYRPTAANRKMVATMTAVGIQQAEMCRVLDIALHTLHKHFRRELDTGVAQANTKIGGRLFAQAEKGNVTAQIFWLKARAGWSETVKVDGDLGFAKLLEVLERRRKKFRAG